MEKKIYWGVALLSVLIWIGSVFWAQKPVSPSDFPWHIEHPTADTVRVFDLTLGKNTPADAEQRFGDEAQPSLFKAPDGRFIMEMYFEELHLAGLKSKIVLTVGIPDSEIQGIYERGERMASTGGNKRITLASQDVMKVREMPIVGITYMPGVRVGSDILLRRFGQPTQRIKENKTGVEHWLYPQNGLDLALGQGAERAVLQYVQPQAFAKLVEPLLAKGQIVSGPVVPASGIPAL